MRRIFVAILSLFIAIVTVRADNNCTDATYYDAGSDTCIACPAGYDYNTDPGKTDITQCQIHCDAGTYVSRIVVPQGYTQLEYIESTGTQYIDTGYKPNNNTRVVMIYMKNSNNDRIGWLFGARNGYMDSSFGTFYDNTPECIQSDYGDQRNNISNSIYDKKLIIDKNKNIQTIKDYDTNATLAVHTSEQRTFTTTYNLYLGALNNAGTTSFYKTKAIYSVKIWDNDILVRDFIPVRRNSDGAAGMYDRVTGAFFGNSGTGTFIAGADVGMIGVECVNVSAGYWAAASTVNFGSVGTRTACPVGTTTVGYGHGADSANDCGRVLHIGDHVVYTRRNKETPHALHARFGDSNEMFYISLSSTNHNMSRLHLSVGGNQYTAYDDSLFYGERDFDTGQPVSQ